MVESCNKDIPLWEHGAPYFDESYGQPQPSLTPYLLENGEAGRGCVIVCPGGAYMDRSECESGCIAQMYRDAGFNAFVLGSRIRPYKYPAQLLDITRAVRVVRYNAERWGIDPSHIAITGFSAGGHLCVMGTELFDGGLGDAAADDIDRVSSRPDAGILCYPVVSFLEYVNEGTRDTLLGDSPDPELLRRLSGEENVPDDMPPIFMWHTSDDEVVPVENSLRLALAMRKKEIPFELHVFPHGYHGLGLAESQPDAAQWTTLACNWLKTLGFQSANT